MKRLLSGATLALSLLATSANAQEFEFKGLTTKTLAAQMVGKTSEPCDATPNTTGAPTAICVLSSDFLPRVADEPVDFAAAAFTDTGLHSMMVALPKGAYSRVETALIIKYGTRCLSAPQAAKWCLADGDVALFVDKGETRMTFVAKKPVVVAERTYRDF